MPRHFRWPQLGGQAVVSSVVAVLWLSLSSCGAAGGAGSRAFIVPDLSASSDLQARGPVPTAVTHGRVAVEAGALLEGIDLSASLKRAVIENGFTIVETGADVALRVASAAFTMDPVQHWVPGNPQACQTGINIGGHDEAGVTVTSEEAGYRVAAGCCTHRVTPGRLVLEIAVERSTEPVGPGVVALTVLLAPSRQRLPLSHIFSSCAGDYHAELTEKTVDAAMQRVIDWALIKRSSPDVQQHEAIALQGACCDRICAWVTAPDALAPI